MNNVIPCKHMNRALHKKGKKENLENPYLTEL